MNYFMHHIVILSLLAQHRLSALYRITEPVVNLLARPGILYNKSAPASPLDTPHLSSQLLYNEPVTIIKTTNGWSLVEAPFHRILEGSKLIPLRGWIEAKQLFPDRTTPTTIELICIKPLTPLFRKIETNPDKFEKINTLPYDSRLSGIQKESSWWKVQLVDQSIGYVPAPSVTITKKLSIEAIRKSIIADARQFLGTPYCWGGTSAFNPSLDSQLTGMDCSGLTHRVYKRHNILIPRNSRAQFFIAKPISPADLKAGDLLFLAYPAGSGRISHVMLYTGEDTFIESWMERISETVLNVQPLHEISTKERLGKSIHEIAQGERCGWYTCYGGSILDTIK